MFTSINVFSLGQDTHHKETEKKGNMLVVESQAEIKKRETDYKLESIEAHVQCDVS